LPGRRRRSAGEVCLRQGRGGSRARSRQRWWLRRHAWNKWRRAVVGNQAARAEPNAHEEECYLVLKPGQAQSYWTINEQRALLEEGKRMASLHPRADRAVVAAGSGLRSSGAPPLPPPAAAPGARGRRVVGKSAREWYTVEESGAVMRGTVVTFGAGTPVVGTRAIVQLPDGSVVFARQFLPAEARAFFAQMPTAVATEGGQAALV